MSKLIGANLEFSLNFSGDTLEFSFLYDLKDRLVDYSIDSKNLGLAAPFKTFFNELVGKPRFAINEAFKNNESKNNLEYLSLASKIIFEFNPTFCEISSSHEMNLENLLCRCFGVSKDEVLDVIDKGARDLTTITNLTRACGGCSSCKIDILEMLKSYTGDLVQVKDTTDTTVKTESEFTKIRREKILNEYPVDFLKKYIFPMQEKYKFEVISLVESTLYIKSTGVVPELEAFIKEHKLSLVTFYI